MDWDAPAAYGAGEHGGSGPASQPFVRTPFQEMHFLVFFNIFEFTGSIRDHGRLAVTCRCAYEASLDDALWQVLCRSRFPDLFRTLAVDHSTMSPSMGQRNGFTFRQQIRKRVFEIRATAIDKIVERSNVASATSKPPLTDEHRRFFTQACSIAITRVCLGAKGVRNLAEWMGPCPAVQSLVLPRQVMEDEGLHALWAHCSRFPHLDTLDLTDNNLRVQALEAALTPMAMDGALPRLQTLTLDGNTKLFGGSEASPTTAKQFIAALSRCVDLRSLSLDGVEMSSEVAAALFNAMAERLPATANGSAFRPSHASLTARCRGVVAPLSMDSPLSRLQAVSLRGCKLRVDEHVATAICNYANRWLQVMRLFWQRCEEQRRRDWEEYVATTAQRGRHNAPNNSNDGGDGIVVGFVVAPPVSLRIELGDDAGVRAGVVDGDEASRNRLRNRVTDKGLAAFKAQCPTLVYAKAAANVRPTMEVASPLPSQSAPGAGGASLVCVEANGSIDLRIHLPSTAADDGCVVS